eukprot:9319734-Ditylum_brightwellii.AAC.1
MEADLVLPEGKNTKEPVVEGKMVGFCSKCRGSDDILHQDRRKAAQIFDSVSHLLLAEAYWDQQGAYKQGPRQASGV